VLPDASSILATSTITKTTAPSRRRFLFILRDHLTRLNAVKKPTKHAASGNMFEKVAADWVKSEARRSKWTPDYQDESGGKSAQPLA